MSIIRIRTVNHIGNTLIMKTLINIHTNAYCCWMDGHIYTGEIPQLLPETATLELMEQYDENFWSKQEIKPDDRINWADYKLIEVEVVRK